MTVNRPAAGSLPRSFRRSSSASSVLAGWEALCRALAIPSYLVPMPSLVAQTLVADAPALVHALWVTLRVTLIALALAVTIGAAVAFLFVQSPIIERSFFPYAVIMQVTPIVAIAPLIIILGEEYARLR